MLGYDELFSAYTQIYQELKRHGLKQLTLGYFSEGYQENWNSKDLNVPQN